MIPETDAEIARRVHLVGIAGAGMSSLAAVLRGRGWRVTGSDAADGAHAAANVPADAELLVRSDAVGADNPELHEAARRGLPVLSYFEALGRLSAACRTLAVAGTHGKSTTAAMLAAILIEAGLDPTVVLGAAPVGESSGGRAGRGAWMVAEACEYRANFLRIHAEAAAILNLESDHFDFYRTAAQLDAAFADFARRLPAEGLLVVGRDSPRAEGAARAARCRVETFGPEAADWTPGAPTAEQGYYRFELCRSGCRLGEVRLRVPGSHNVQNALAAAALASHAGVANDAIRQALARFGGVARRLQPRGTWRGVALVDDYAHHPTEVKAAVQAVREMYPGARLCCVFQPHQASRTQALLDELAASLDNTDMALVADIFRAREPNQSVPEVTAADLAERVRRRGGRAEAVGPLPEIATRLCRDLRAGDVLLVMGAGDIGRLHELLTEITE